MIFYISGDGGAKLVSASPVHQGSADTCRIGVIAPFADNVQVTCAFRLADGSTLAPALMTRSAKLDGIFVQATDSAVGYWEYDLPGAVSEKYGRTYVQFYFYSAEEGAVFASAETSFLVSRGVSAQLPETPDETVYGQILSAIAELSGDVFNGYYAARAIYAWNSEFTYGANEITFYPDYGEYGAFVKSVTVDNKGNAPYTDGVLDSSHWEEVTDFNALQELAGKVEDIETYVQQASDSAAAAAGSAEAAEAAQTAAETAQTAAETAEDNAKNAETAAQGYADAAAESAALAEQWANAGIQVNTDYTSVDDLPRPGTSKYIYFVPVGGADEDNVYDEYIWVADKEDYELIGNTRVDLSGYAQQNGNYPQMTVGAAGYSQNVTEQIGGKALGEIFESDGTTAKEATSAETAGKVGHKLTVTVNGQATEFDGSSDKSVTISTDEATDPEAVRFTQQTLTSEQQAQARANIGAQAAGNYYVKPSGGIPKSDLAGAVQTSLDKADSALQSAPVTSVAGRTGTVTLAKSDVGLSNVDNVKQYSASNPPPYPVTSVAGKTGAVALAKSDVGLGNVDNVKQYSASNPPPYPVTSVNGQTGAVEITAANVETLSGLDFDPGFGQTSGNIVGYRIGKLVVITVVFTPGSSGIAWRDLALAEGIPIPASSNSDPIPQYVGTCIPETPCALSNDDINDVQFNLRAYKGSSRLWIHRCTNTNGAAVGAGVQFRGTIVYICQ